MKKHHPLSCATLVLLIIGGSGCGSRTITPATDPAAAYAGLPPNAGRIPVPPGSPKQPLPEPQSQEEDSLYLMRSIALDIAAERLHPDILEVLLSADCVNCYRLMYADSVAGTFEVEPNYVRVTDPSRLSDYEIDILLDDLVLSPDAYGHGELQIESPYLPFCEFEFVAPQGEGADKSVSLIISPADRTWTVASKGRKLTNYDMPDPDRTLMLCQKKVTK